MSAAPVIGAGSLDDAKGVNRRAEHPPPYAANTPVGEHLRVESLLRVTDGRLYHLVNNLGSKWAWRKCWACGNRYSPTTAQSCTYCMTPLRDLQFLMSVRWDAAWYKPFERMVARRLDHFGLITPVVVYYRDGRMLSVYHYSGETQLVDVPGPLPPDRLVAMGQFLCQMVGFLHQHGVILRRLSPEHLLVMPDQSVRLFDPEVFDVVSGEDAVERHPSRPGHRMVVAIAELLIRYCPLESDELAALLDRAAAGRIQELRAFGHALADLYLRGAAPPVVSKASAYSDLGLVRSHNEDRWGWRRLADRASLYIVADGMGGHARGDVAATLAVRATSEAMAKLPPAPSPDAIQKALEGAFKHANRVVRGEGTDAGAASGTTLTAAVVDGRQLIVASTGDSRAYLLRAGTLEQLTRDHTVAQDLVDSGKLQRGQEKSHPHGHVLTSNLGVDDEDLEIDTHRRELRSGDRLMLCSDGLWGKVEDGRMGFLLARHPDRAEAIQALVREAYLAGGDDNVTVMVVDL